LRIVIAKTRTPSHKIVSDIAASLQIVQNLSRFSTVARSMLTGCRSIAAFQVSRAFMLRTS
jgi:hypothetical protein